MQYIESNTKDKKTLETIANEILKAKIKLENNIDVE